MLDPFRPKYLTALGVPYSAMDYGDGTFLVGVALTDPQHAALIANADVIAFPPLADVVGGNPTLNQIRNELESRSIPGAWVQSTTTYRELVGTVGRLTLIVQRMAGSLGKKLFGTGNGLNTTLTTTLRDDFIAVGQSFGVNTSGITTSITVSAALMLLANQMPSFSLAGEVF